MALKNIYLERNNIKNIEDQLIPQILVDLFPSLLYNISKKNKNRIGIK